MKVESPSKTSKMIKKAHPFLVWGGACVVLGVGIFLVLGFSPLLAVRYSATLKAIEPAKKVAEEVVAVFDKAAYDKKMHSLANNPVVAAVGASTGGTSTRATSSAQHISTSTKKTLWPVTSAPYPNIGALLPFKRIVAFYGNFFSTGMGVLGQYPEAQMLEKLRAASAEWNQADPSTPVVPAIEYIDVTAQGSPGKSGTYSLRMPDSQIEHAIELADKVHGIVILDIQVGLSNLRAELPLLDAYLKIPNVHLALDPEFSMKTGAKPGTKIGTFDAADINYAADYLAKIVRDNNLPPKVLVVHRFTEPMVTNYKLIRPLPEVQIVMDMDGWGPPEKKIGTYNSFIAPEPVQFTGFKLFYKNDLRAPSKRLLTPAELLKLTPQPIFIQYQ